MADPNVCIDLMPGVSVTCLMMADGTFHVSRRATKRERSASAIVG